MDNLLVQIKNNMHSQPFRQNFRCNAPASVAIAADRWAREKQLAKALHQPLQRAISNHVYTCVHMSTDSNYVLTITTTHAIYTYKKYAQRGNVCVPAMWTRRGKDICTETKKINILCAHSVWFGLYECTVLLTWIFTQLQKCARVSKKKHKSTQQQYL